MKRLKKILLLALMVTALSCLFCQPAFAISEEEVQAQVDAVGKEAVSGNVLIWFMCAIGFLKVSQKIDSFMASVPPEHGTKCVNGFPASAVVSAE